MLNGVLYKTVSKTMSLTNCGPLQPLAGPPLKSAGELISAGIIAMKMRVVMAGWSRGGRPLNEQTDFACFSVFFFLPTPASSSALGCSHETFFFVKFKLVSREVVHFVPFNDVWFAFPFISSAIPPKEQPNFFFFNHCAFFPDSAVLCLSFIVSGR